MDERWRSAFHETGHALAALASPHAPQPKHVSILENGRMSGHVRFVGPLKMVYRSREHVESVAFILLCGPAAEERAMGAAAAQSAALESYGANDDVAQLARILILNRRLVAECAVEGLVASATERARRFVRDHWHLIKSVAVVLERRYELGPEEMAICRRGLLISDQARRAVVAEVTDAISERTAQLAAEAAWKRPMTFSRGRA